MTIAVDWDVKNQIKQTNNFSIQMMLLPKARDTFVLSEYSKAKCAEHSGSVGSALDWGSKGC